MALIETSNLEKQFDRRSVLKGIDLIIVNEHLDQLLMGLSKETLDKMNDIFIRTREIKPIVIVSSPGFVSTEMIALEKKLANARVTVYPSLDRAAKAIANMNWYYRFHLGAEST